MRRSIQKIIELGGNFIITENNNIKLEFINEKVLEYPNVKSYVSELKENLKLHRMDLIEYIKNDIQKIEEHGSKSVKEFNSCIDAQAKGFCKVLRVDICDKTLKTTIIVDTSTLLECEKKQDVKYLKEAIADNPFIPSPV